MVTFKRIFTYCIGAMIVPLERCLAGYREQRVSRMLGGGKRKINYPFTIVGIRNFHVAENVGIGPGSTIYCTSAKITIDRHFMAGPNLTIMTGDHDWQVGRFIDSIGEKEKNPERDGDVHIEQDVWIGANVTILKGVTIGESSIVGAGSVVTKNVPPCSIVAGCPAKVIGMKWSEEDIARHRAFLIDGKA